MSSDFPNYPPKIVGELFDTAATNAVDVLSSDVSPSKTCGAFRITVGIKPAAMASVFNVQVNNGGTAILQSFNGGAALSQLAKENRKLEGLDIVTSRSTSTRELMEPAEAGEGEGQ